MGKAHSLRIILQVECVRCTHSGAGVCGEEAGAGIANGKVIGGAVRQGEKFRKLRCEDAAEKHADNSAEQNPRVE